MSEKRVDHPIGTKAHYCIQCKEPISGNVGDFVFTGDSDNKVAISPVFTSLVDLYPWMRSNGWMHTSGSVLECHKFF